MNFQDVIRDVHDLQNHALNISGTINAAGQATVTLASSDQFIGIVTVANPASANLSGNVTLNPSPNFIGIVTIANPGSSSGNVTLDAGSKTQIVGNLTLSDSKNFIGLVTVGNTVSTTFSGNVTLDGGSKTQISGNVTISDSKGYIGLVTATLDNSRGVAFSGNVTLDGGSRTGLVGTVTIQDGGNSITIDGNVGVTGNITLSDSKGYIGLVTVTQASSARTITGNLTLTDSKTFIGLVTVGNTVTVAIDQTGTNNDVQLLGNVTITDSKGFIGLVTVVQSSTARTITGNITLDAGSLVGVRGNITLSDPKTFIGLVTAQIVGSVNTGMLTLFPGPNFIGLVTAFPGSAYSLVSGYPMTGIVTIANKDRTITGNLTLSDAKTNIGLVTLTGGTAWTDPKTYIGLVTAFPGSAISLVSGYPMTGIVTVANIGRTITGNLTLDAGSKTGIVGNVTLSDSKTFIGAVTAWTRNAGTAKTLTHTPISFLSAGSLSTIAVPATNLSMYITNMIISSDATVRVNIKSGVTYMTGNASIGITINPGGGFVQSGSPDSPVWIGLPSGAIVLEKFDMTGTKANIGGNFVYFSE